MKVPKSLFLFIVFIVFIHSFTIYYLFKIEFYISVNKKYVLIYIADSFLMVMIFITLVISFRKKIRDFGSSFDVEKLVSNLKYLLFIIYIYLIIKVYFSLSKIISGAKREDLVLGESAVTGLDTIIVSPIILIVFSLYIYFGKSLALKLLLLVGLVLSMLIGASRSEFALVIFYFLIWSGLYGFVEKKWTLILGSFFIISGGLLMTIFVQNRPISSGLSGAYDIFDSFFRYRAYSFFLADFAIEVSANFEKILYPFLGYFSERPLQFFSPINPIDSAFVSNRIYLGDLNANTNRPMLANVLYPWWSWFYGMFGVFGLLVKSCFSFIVIYFTLRKNLIITFVGLSLMFILIGSTRHPLLTLGDIINIIVLICLDLYYIRISKEKFLL